MSSKDLQVKLMNEIIKMRKQKDENKDLIKKYQTDISKARKHAVDNKIQNTLEKEYLKLILDFEKENKQIVAKIQKYEKMFKNLEPKKKGGRKQKGGNAVEEFKLKLDKEMAKELKNIIVQKRLLKGQFKKKAEERINESKKRIKRLSSLKANIVKVGNAFKKEGASETVEEKMVRMRKANSIEDMFKIFEGGRKKVAKKNKKKSKK